MNPNPKFALPFVLLGLAVFAALSCQRQEARKFSIPSGPAAETLKIFANQARVEILFDSEQLRGERTRAVYGQMTSRESLEEMLKGTELQFSIDPKSHAYAVIRKQQDSPKRDP